MPMKMPVAGRFLVCTLCLTVGCGLTFAQRRGRGGPGNEFAFRFLGPAAGNRVSAVAGIPGDPSTYYAGAASGGIWKSTDGGNRWAPIFDEEPVAAIGALAVAPSDPNVVWAGTGEAWAIRDIDVTGDGVYKSTDAGKTWEHMGLDQTGRIGRVVIDPEDPERVYVCALGRMTDPQQERGIYRTTDGGKTWDRVLFVDPNTGCSGIGIDPKNPRTLFAGMWEAAMHTWGFFSGGPGSGLYVSHDRGTTWTHIEGHGLPHSPVGKIDVAVAPTDSNRVYALIETSGQGSVWRSDDGGDELASGELGSHADRARGLLHPHRGFARRRKQGPGLEQRAFWFARRRAYISGDGVGRRQPRYLDGCEGSEPLCDLV